MQRKVALTLAGVQTARLSELPECRTRRSRSGPLSGSGTALARRSNDAARGAFTACFFSPNLCRFITRTTSLRNREAPMTCDDMRDVVTMFLWPTNASRRTQNNNDELNECKISNAICSTLQETSASFSCSFIVVAFLRREERFTDVLWSVSPCCHCHI